MNRLVSAAPSLIFVLIASFNELRRRSKLEPTRALRITKFGDQTGHLSITRWPFETVGILTGSTDKTARL